MARLSWSYEVLEVSTAAGAVCVGVAGSHGDGVCVAGVVVVGGGVVCSDGRISDE